MMITPFLQKRHWPVVAVIAVVLSFAPSRSRAQMNPFNMRSEFGAHMNFESAKSFANHASAKWNRYNQALAAAGGKDMMFRFELGGGIILTDASIKFSLRTIHGNEITHDTSLAFTGKPVENGYHIAWASGYPLATLSDNAALILTYGMSYDNLKWAIPKMTIDGRETEFNFSSNTIGVPLYLDYKWGAEAMLDISKRLCFTAGAGALPAYSLTVGDNTDNSSRFTVRPSARIEAGLATKFISFKLQATAILGDVKFVSGTDILRDVDYYAGLSENYDIRIQGHSQFIFSLVLLATTTSWQYKPWFR